MPRLERRVSNGGRLGRIFSKETVGKHKVLDEIDGAGIESEKILLIFR
jgi:hypothetical protein